ncbi:MAG: LPXTG cell wall anchor domain-containing protein [Lachnospiraceae bacterium]|nr:LPXTG cell wall anchor domain-containing protein [Lachnospiraceae bacterium]
MANVLRRKKVFIIIICIALLMMLIPNKALAASKTDSRVTLNLSIAKTTLKAGEETKIIGTVKNVSSKTLYNVQSNLVLPKSLKVVSGKTSDFKDELGAKKTTSFTLAVKATESTDVTVISDVSTKTGDNNNILPLALGVLASLIIIAALIRRKKASKFLSLLLCISMVGVFGSGIKVKAAEIAAAGQSNFSITIDRPIKLGTKNANVTLKTTYSTKKNNIPIPTNPIDDTYTISGVITADDDYNATTKSKPVPALVELLQDGHRLADNISAIADSDGYYVLRGIKPGDNYAIRATYAPYAIKESMSNQVDITDKNITNYNLEMTKGRMIWYVKPTDANPTFEIPVSMKQSSDDFMEDLDGDGEVDTNIDKNQDGYTDIDIDQDAGDNVRGNYDVYIYVNDKLYKTKDHPDGRFMGYAAAYKEASEYFDTADAEATSNADGVKSGVMVTLKTDPETGTSVDRDRTVTYNDDTKDFTVTPSSATTPRLDDEGNPIEITEADTSPLKLNAVNKIEFKQANENDDGWGRAIGYYSVGHEVLNHVPDEDTADPDDMKYEIDPHYLTNPDTLEYNIEPAKYVGQNSLVKVDVLATANMLLPYEEMIGNTIGNYFEQYKYFGCVNLTNIEDVEGMLDVTTIGKDFQMGKYAFCNNIKVTVGIDSLTRVINIGDNFQAFKFANCENITSVENIGVLSAKDGMVIGDNFEWAKYMNCKSIVEAEKIDIIENVEVLGNNFERAKYMGCISLEQPEDITPINHVKVVKDNCAVRKYSGCYSLDVVEDMPKVSGMETVGTFFGAYKYENCYSLDETEYITFDNLQSAGIGLGQGKFLNCININNHQIQDRTYSIAFVEDQIRDNWQHFGNFTYMVEAKYIDPDTGEFINPITNVRTAGNSANGGLPFVSSGSLSSTLANIDLTQITNPPTDVVTGRTHMPEYATEGSNKATPGGLIVDNGWASYTPWNFGDSGAPAKGI